MRFKFANITTDDILASRGGQDMLDAIQYSGNDDLFITGRPGSGKTTVTIMRTHWLSLQGKTPLFLTYHNLLVYSLWNAHPQLRQCVWGLYDWYHQVTKHNLSADKDAE